MLCQFSFKNYKSYKNENIIEMQAEHDEDFEESLLEVNGLNEKFLPVSAIYGPNGGGKTIALEALICLVTHITGPIVYLKSNKVIDIIKAVPYKFDDDINHIVSFEIYYIVNNYEYKYCLDISDTETIINEILYRRKLNVKKPEMIFNREKNKIDLGESLKKQKANINVSENMTYLAFLGVSQENEIIKEALSFFENIFMLNKDFLYKIPNEIFKDKKYKEAFLALLNAIDSAIVDFEIVEKDDGNYDILTEHKVNNKKYMLNLSDESVGTIKIFGLIPHIIHSLLTGSVCIIDELDSKLHPRIIQFIIELYKDKQLNPRNAQLLFTSHDLATMSNKVFRRDEILFAAKNEKEESELYSLYEVRGEDGRLVSTKSSYSKQYLEGKYGADPYLTKILKWEE